MPPGSGSALPAPIQNLRNYAHNSTGWLASSYIRNRLFVARGTSNLPMSLLIAYNKAKIRQSAARKTLPGQYTVITNVFRLRWKLYTIYHTVGGKPATYDRSASVSPASTTAKIRGIAYKNHPSTQLLYSLLRIRSWPNYWPVEVHNVTYPLLAHTPFWRTFQFVRRLVGRVGKFRWARDFGGAGAPKGGVRQKGVTHVRILRRDTDGSLTNR
jgi:hypothetical protein